MTHEDVIILGKAPCGIPSLTGPQAQATGTAAKSKMSRKSNRKGGSMYIYDIPYSNFHQLCQRLDTAAESTNGGWKSLAGALGYRQDDVILFGTAQKRAGGSPAEELLRDYGHRNPTAMDLFRVLKKLNFVRIADALRGIIPDKCFKEWEDSKKVPDDPVPKQKDEDVYLCTADLPGPPMLPPIVTNKAFQANKGSVAPPAACTRPERVTGGATPPHLRSKLGPVEQHDHGLTASEKAGSCGPSDASLESLSETSMDIKMDEIEEATRNFNEQFVIGRGGFGTVYKVMLKRIATTVAVKVLQQLSSHRKEFEHLLRYRHENIIPLYGFSMDEERFCLIYQYMPNGSLEDRLARKYDSVPLTWEQRHNILLGTARGLQFIHSAMDKPLLHGDIKSANVLLDKHFEAKIGDFGLAKVANSGGNFKYTHVSEVDPNAKVYGSKAYLPAEYLSGQHKLRKDTDVYSFGVVIFETCTGRMALDEQRPSGQKALTDVMSLHDEANTLTKLMDATVPAWPVQLWCLVVQLGIRCTAAKRTSRPAIERVYDDLYKVVQLAETMKGSLGSGQRRPTARPLGSMAPSERSHHVDFESESASASLLEPNVRPHVVFVETDGKLTDDYLTVAIPTAAPVKKMSPVSEVSEGQRAVAVVRPSVPREKVRPWCGDDSSTELKEQRYDDASPSAADSYSKPEGKEADVTSSPPERPASPGPFDPIWSKYDSRKLADDFRPQGSPTFPPEETVPMILQEYYERQKELREHVGEQPNLRPAAPGNGSPPVSPEEMYLHVLGENRTSRPPPRKCAPPAVLPSFNPEDQDWLRVLEEDEERHSSFPGCARPDTRMSDIRKAMSQHGLDISVPLVPPRQKIPYRTSPERPGVGGRPRLLPPGSLASGSEASTDSQNKGLTPNSSGTEVSGEFLYSDPTGFGRLGRLQAVLPPTVEVSDVDSSVSPDTCTANVPSSATSPMKNGGQKEPIYMNLSALAKALDEGKPVQLSHVGCYIENEERLNTDELLDCSPFHSVDMGASPLDLDAGAGGQSYDNSVLCTEELQAAGNRGRRWPFPESQTGIGPAESAEDAASGSQPITTFMDDLLLRNLQVVTSNCLPTVSQVAPPRYQQAGSCGQEFPPRYVSPPNRSADGSDVTATRVNHSNTHEDADVAKLKEADEMARIMEEQMKL